MLILFPRLEHNGTSPLLFKLIPAEIRAKIFTYVLGDDTIYTNHRKEPGVRKPIAYGSIPCNRHYYALLQTCRAIYAEAHPIFWSTNIFHFAHPTTFKTWMEARIAHEKRLIRRMHLRLDLSNHPDSGVMPDVWNAVLFPRVIQSLPGLRDLGVSVNHVRYIAPEGQRKREFTVKSLFRGTRKGFLGFAVLPLREVVVSMETTLMFKVQVGPGRREWVVGETRKWRSEARMLRRKLLNIRNDITAEGEK